MKNRRRKRRELSDYARELIYHKAWQMVGKAGYTASDVEDIQQEMTLDLLERLPRFDPGKAESNTFAALVVERKRCSLLRHRLSERRDPRREGGSLHANPIATAHLDRQRGRRVAPDQGVGQEHQDRQMDIAEAMAALPPDLRRVAQMLGTQTVAQVARALGIPRTTFRQRQMTELRWFFRARGLQDYLL